MREVQKSLEETDGGLYEDCKDEMMESPTLRLDDRADNTAAAVSELE